MNDRDTTLLPTATVGSSSGEALPLLERGALLGRYVVLEPIGAGGMGQIYAAFDPDLGRRVALKVIRAGFSSAFSEQLLHEARALARLQHVNVLRVYDVGVAAGRTFVATELLSGENVNDWAKRETRRWQEVLAVFLEVGRGLQAVHGAGLVHRDIKPTNMMINDDGRVVLIDFGIAAAGADGEGLVLDPGALEISPRSLPSAPLQPAGTPGFMAPEQHVGGAIGPAADLFAFCASLYRVLYRQAPFADDADAPLRPPPPGNKAPRALEAILARGLARTPERRFADMAALLEALEHVLGARRRNQRLGLACAVIALIGGLIFWQHQSRKTLCFDGATRFAATFDPAHRSALAAVFTVSESPFAADLGRSTVATIESFGAIWGAQGEAFCREGRRGQVSAELVDLRQECLAQRLRELDAALTLATSGRALELNKVAELFSNLEPVGVCADAQALRAPSAPRLAGAEASTLARLRGAQAALAALLAAGLPREGRERSLQLIEEVRPLNHLPLLAELLLERGLFEDALVDEAALETLDEAATTAAACGHERVVAEALIRKVRVLGLRRQDFGAADQALALAHTALGRLGRPDLLAAELADLEGLIARLRGRYPEAKAAHRAALEVRLGIQGAEHPAVANTRVRLANVLDDAGDKEGARQELEQAQTIQMARLGPHHPALADTLTRLATLARERGEKAMARTGHAQALAIRERVFGGSSIQVAESLTYLAELAALEHDFGAADHDFARALAIIETELGRDHPHRAITLATMASAYTEAERDEAALAPYREALAIFERKYGRDHPHVGVLQYNLGSVLSRLGRYDAALGHYEEGARVATSSQGEGHAFTLSAWTGVGDTLERLGRTKSALEVLERVATAENAGEREAKVRADGDFALARALLKIEPASQRARQLLASARKLYAEDRVASRRELAELDALVAQRHLEGS